MSGTLETEQHLAYFTTSYPNVSHTFIRREILELERLGHTIIRVAVRASGALVDPEDIAEQEQTLHLLEQSLVWHAFRIIAGTIAARLSLIRAIGVTWKLNRASDRGLLRHVAYLLEALALRSYFRKQRIHHVHVHFGTNAAAVAMLVNVIGGPSYSMTIHGPDEFDGAIAFSLRDKMQAALFTIAISSYCAAQLRRWVPYEEWCKIHVVHCTVGKEWMAAVTPVNYDADSVVSVGRLSAQKGQLLLVDAIAEAARRGFSERVYLIGDGEMRPVIEERIESHELGNQVKITGWRSGPDIRKQLLNAKALVLPSIAEGLPVVIMESMALARPVLSTYVAGIPELVVDGEHGWLVVAGDRDGLVDALLDLHERSIDSLRKMGRACAERVRQRHSVASEVAKLNSLFLSVARVSHPKTIVFRDA